MPMFIVLKKMESSIEQGTKMLKDGQIDLWEGEERLQGGCWMIIQASEALLRSPRNIAWARVYLVSEDPGQA